MQAGGQSSVHVDLPELNARLHGASSAASSAIAPCWSTELWARMWSADGGPTIHGDPVLQCFARSVPSLSGRPMEFVVAACRSAYILHAAELDARASAVSAPTRRTLRLLQDSNASVESAFSECADSTLGRRHDEPPEATTLTWSDSDADDECTESSNPGRDAACYVLVYDIGNTGALLKRHLTDPRFRVTESPPGGRPAILWARSTRYAPSHAVQWRHSFHGEEWVTEKDWLARLVQLAAGRVSWSPESFTICDRSTETGSMRNQVSPVFHCVVFLHATARQRWCLSARVDQQQPPCLIHEV